MKTTYNKEDIRIVEGEVYLHKNKDEFQAGDFDLSYPVITASTAELENVPKLERKWFVKPKEDVEKLAADYALENSQCMCNDREYGFEAGFKANPAVYTEEEMREAVKSVSNVIRSLINLSDAEIDSYIRSCISRLRPLSIPNSITLDENFNLVSIEW